MRFSFPLPPRLDKAALVAQLQAANIPGFTDSISLDERLHVDLQGVEELTAEQEATLTAVIADYAYQPPADEYRRLRVAAYAAELPIGDQLEALLEGGAKLDTIRTKYAAIKARHPKPTM